MEYNFNNSREQLTPQDLEDIHELLSARLRAKNSDLLWARLHHDLRSIPYHGILGKIYKDKYGWQYCTGQDYSEEIKTIRKIILTLK